MVEEVGYVETEFAERVLIFMVLVSTFILTTIFCNFSVSRFRKRGLTAPVSASVSGRYL